MRKEKRPIKSPNCQSKIAGSSRKGIFIPLLILLLALSPVAAIATNPDEGLTSLEDLIIEADENNEAYLASQANFDRYQARVPIMKLLDEKLLAFYYLDFPIANMGGGSTLRRSQSDSGKAQMIIGAKKVRGKIVDGLDMVEDKALWYKHVSEDLRLQTYRKAKEGFYRLFFHDRIIAVTEESLRTLQNLVSTSQEQYAVGRLNQTEVLKTQARRSRLLGQLMDLRLRRVELVNDLNALTSRPANSPLTADLAEVPTLRSLQELGSSKENLLDSLIRYRPLLQGYQALGARFRAMEMMVRKYYNRDLREEAVFEVDSGLRALKAERNDFYNRLQAEIVTASAGLEKSRRHAKLYAEVTLPLDEQIYQSSLADYQVGKGRYQEVLQALLDLYQDRVSLLQSQSNYQSELARLEAATGQLLSPPKLPTADEIDDSELTEKDIR